MPTAQQCTPGETFRTSDRRIGELRKGDYYFLGVMFKTIDRAMREDKGGARRVPQVKGCTDTSRRPVAVLNPSSLHSASHSAACFLSLIHI